MSLITQLAQAIRKLKYGNHFELATKDPIRYQERLLLKLVRNNANTEYGRMHLFEQIKSIKDFQVRVPVNGYPDLKRFIEEEKKGVQNVLTKQPLIMFAVTSGTTGEPKYCPVTRDFAQDYKKNWELWMYYANRDHPRMFDGKILDVISPQQEGFVAGGIPYGSISGLMASSQSAFIQSYYAVPYEAFCIKEYEARYYAILRFALEKNITWIVTPNPSMILLLAKKALQHKDDLIKDIEAGTLNKELKIEENIRQSLEKLLKPNPYRARQLKETEFLPKSYWPKLSLIGCWKEGSLPLYIRQLTKFFDHVPVRDIGLISTEGHTTIPISDDGGKGVLAVSTHFFEFMPVGSKHALLCNQLEEGKEYFMILTTSSGLYRYFINDIVKVVGYYNKTPIIEFLHKGEHITSITGEKLTEWQVVNAVRRASHELQIPVDSLTAVANTKRSGYDFLMEFHTKFAPDRKFINQIDEELKKLNIEYKQKRESGRLKKPALKVVKEGSYHHLHKLRSEKAGHDAQVKIPALTDDQKFEKQFKVVKKI